MPRVWPLYECTDHHSSKAGTAKTPTLALITSTNTKNGSSWGQRRAKSFGQLRAATFTPRRLGAKRGPPISDAP